MMMTQTNLVRPFIEEADFTFSDTECESLEAKLEEVKISPFKFYDIFVNQIRNLLDDEAVPMRFRRFVEELATRDAAERPVIVIKNAPYDHSVPPFDFDEPVKSKYERKKTFVAEGFLALFGLLRNTPGIGYLNVNDGDVFQDIYPKRDLQASQSQKALNDIYFHKDLANHFVRPDHVYMIGMRSDPANKVYTSFVRNIDVTNAFSEEELSLLRMPRFYTPFDDLTVYGGQRPLGRAENHPIISGNSDLRYFENRTQGIDEESQCVVDKLQRLLHQFKVRLFIGPGDFICCYNNYTTHAKEVLEINNPETLKTRWIIKTVNVDRLEDWAQHMVPGSNYLVNG
jgi:L-asparagine oxygenase